MELRQLRYFVRVVELGSISRAAQDLELVQSALSQQISRLESELSTRLLQRSPKGVTPTEAGLAFFREAQLVLRHAEQAVRSAQQSRLSGSVSVGMAPTTAVRSRAACGSPRAVSISVKREVTSSNEAARNSHHWRVSVCRANATTSREGRAVR